MDEQRQGQSIVVVANRNSWCSIEQVGNDILVCDLLTDEIYDGFKFAREEERDTTETKEKTMRELMNEELDISKEMEILRKHHRIPWEEL